MYGLHINHFFIIIFLKFIILQFKVLIPVSDSLLLMLLRCWQKELPLFIICENFHIFDIIFINVAPICLLIDRDEKIAILFLISLILFVNPLPLILNNFLFKYACSLRLLVLCLCLHSFSLLPRLLFPFSCYILLCVDRLA